MRSELFGQHLESTSDDRMSLQNPRMLKGALIGRGSGEAIQLAPAGDGFVVVRASAGPVVPAHDHGDSGGGGGLFS